jgi:plastocyanin
MTRFLKYGTAAAVVLTAAFAFASAALAAPEARTVLIKDKCDSATFPPGLCAPGEGVSFETFKTQLAASGQAGGWRFAPAQLSLSPGTDLTVINTGRETHTFTTVANFGPGFVPFLNELVFGPGATAIPEFNPVNPATARFMAPGATRTLSLAPGTYKFECGIHPWMQTTVTVG